MDELSASFDRGSKEVLDTINMPSRLNIVSLEKYAVEEIKSSNGPQMQLSGSKTKTDCED